MLTKQLLNFYLIGAEWVLWVLVALSVLWLSIWVERIILYFQTREDFDKVRSKLLEKLRENKVYLFQKEGEEIETFSTAVLNKGFDALKNGEINSLKIEQAMMSEVLQQKNRFEKNLSILATVGNNAPFIGLFGTVLGIVQAFFQLGKQGVAQQASSNELVMSAIAEALVATGVGIMVAIPAVIAFNWSKSLVLTRCRSVESLVQLFLANISKGKL